jgi:crotonobetainyl-CoA:carnitine CoA-transferase CaiB-like acyl-CoA transferase
LDTIVVVDLSQGIPGAYASKMFADAGAKVYIGEPPLGAKRRRSSDPGDRALFEFLTHGKSSIVVGDWPDALDLVHAAHVVVEDGLPQSQVAQLLAIGLVVVSITPFGRSGPMASRRASELTIQAESGCLATRGDKAEMPFQAGGHIVEWVTGAYAAVAALAAVRGGVGEHIDVSMLEVAALTGTNFLSVSHELAGRPPIEGPIRVIEVPEIHASSDGWVGFTTNSAQQFQDFLVLIGRADLLGDAMLATAAGRQARLAEFRELVENWTAKRTTEEIVAEASALRIPVAPVLNGETVAEFPHFRERRVLVRSPGGFLMPRRPWRLDDEDPPGPQPSPALGSGKRPPRRSRSQRQGVQLPLKGVRIVDLTAWWAGPTATHLLACLGAEVVHVESPKRPDGMRMTGGVYRHLPAWWERSSFFLTVNTNKSDLVVDLTSDAGRNALLKVIANADVVIENFTPRVLDSLRLDWPVIVAANPRCSLVRMPAFGLSGPWRDAPGFAQTMEQVSGLAWMTGFAESQPHNQRGPTDPNGGVHAAFGALVTLAARERDGRGHLVESSFVEVALNSSARSIIEYSLSGRLFERDGNRDDAMAPQGVYPARGKDEWIALSVEDDEQWRRLVDVLDLPVPIGWSVQDRRLHHDAIDEAIARWTALRDREDAVSRLIAAGITVGNVVDPRLIAVHPQMMARGYFERVTHPVVGEIDLPGLPFRYRSTGSWLRHAAPLFGQDNRDALHAAGLDEGEIDALEAVGIVAATPANL